MLEGIKAKGYRIGVISNADGSCDRILKEVGLEALFEFIIDSHIVGVEKPDPAIFNLAIRSFALPPDEILYVGDLYHIDVVGSRGAGLQSALIQPKLTCAFGDCFMVRDLRHLLELLPQRT